MPTVWELHAARRTFEGMSFRNAVREMGFNYIGRSTPRCPSAHRHAEQREEASRAAISTCRHAKGKGYAPAEADPIKWHGPGRSIRPAARFSKKSAQARRIRRSLAGALRHADRDPSIIGITAGNAEGSVWLNSRNASQTYFDVAIAEQHAVYVRRGLASKFQGRSSPFIRVLAARLRPAHSRRRVQNLPVVFALDRAGLVGSDACDASGKLRPVVPALHPQHGAHDARG